MHPNQGIKMKIDIVFPKNNEKEFIRLAEKLDWGGLCFVYSGNFKNNKTRLKELSKTTKLKLFAGLLALQKDIQKARQISDLVIVNSSEKDQYVLEKSPPDVLFGMEFHKTKESMHFRASGLNQVLCKLANNNKVIIPIPLKLINDSDNKPLIFGRIMQNIMLCRKYKVEQAIASFAEKPYELKSSNGLMSLAITLGMDIPSAKKSLNSIGEKIKHNQKKKSPDYIKEGIELVK